MSWWWLLIPLWALYIAWALRRRKRVRAAILAYLREHPGWHFVPEIREATHMSRGLAYFMLGSMDEAGEIESMEAERTIPGTTLRRILYRAPERTAAES